MDSSRKLSSVEFFFPTAVKTSEIYSLWYLKNSTLIGLQSSFQALQKTKAVHHTSNPIWNQRFEFDEIEGGEYLKIKCYSEETLGDENIGSARVNLEGLAEGSTRDVWVPLEKVNSGELRLIIEAVRMEDNEVLKVGFYIGIFPHFFLSIVK